MEIEFAWYRIVDWWERWRYGDDRDDEANSGDDWEWTPSRPLPGGAIAGPVMRRFDKGQLPLQVRQPSGTDSPVPPAPKVSIGERGIRRCPSIEMEQLSGSSRPHHPSLLK